MGASIGLNRMEVTGSNNLGTSVYKVTFDLTATEVPVNQTDEHQVLARAREVLHDVLTQLADAARPPK